MKLTVLGCHSPYPPVDGAGPGYLLTHAGANLLLDCGSGVVSKLGQYLDPKGGKLAAVVLSHLHADHFCDLLVLRYAHMLAMQGTQVPPLAVYCPDVPETERAVIPFRDVLSLHTIDERSHFSLAGMTFAFYRTKHIYPCYAVRIEAEGRSLVYTGDTAWDDNLVEFAALADVLLVEACFTEQNKGENPAQHMSARECGALAEQAIVGKLILTHLPPVGDCAELLAEARAAFSGETSVAFSGLCLEL
ncbi:MAG: Ribonuclease BN [Firmicutes bacterium]|nr:Ribonuclease BN [candidate division NPL-UPA2 bacterium]MBT9153827.1 Ribonuclease BN [candidate division NPL-UPA2 bacterium]